jgi:hypothetical protein
LYLSPKGKSFLFVYSTTPQNLVNFEVQEGLFYHFTKSSQEKRNENFKFLGLAHHPVPGPSPLLLFPLLPLSQPKNRVPPSLQSHQ